ncbi:MAG: hypothetical protein IPO08_23005 [Xanthomonadales bacterium]|nr:hypothetical protein [Xanthomonadales bacterium]
MNKECNGCTDGCNHGDDGFGAMLSAILGNESAPSCDEGRSVSIAAHNALELQQMQDAIRRELDDCAEGWKIVGVAVSVIVEDEDGERRVLDLESDDGVAQAIYAAHQSDEMIEELLDASQGVLKAVGRAQ